jgi:aspartate/methionine/tyrosine aminotransferase
MRIADIVSPFPRNRRLLDHIEPGASVIDMTIGEPRHAMPPFVVDVLSRTAAEFGKYPPIKGTPTLRAAIADWIGRRYRAGALIDAEKHVLPIVGSREGLFSAAFPALDRRRDIRHPAVLMPNPFYQVYAAAAISAGAEPIFLAARREHDFLPDLDALEADTELLQRTVAFYICSPANPQGTTASRDYLARALQLARRYDFVLFSDECYSEVYTETPPVGAIEAAAHLGGGLANLIVFNSLSKRSNLPGLRTGFAAGDATFIESFAEMRNVSAPQMPLPIQHVSEAVWREETHVEASRQGYREKFALADRILGNRYGYRRPGGGFFLWLDVSQFGGSEAATVTLWKRSGVKVLPGAYLARDVAGASNPGADFIRVALVHDTKTTEAALERIIDVLA